MKTFCALPSRRRLLRRLRPAIFSLAALGASLVSTHAQTSSPANSQPNVEMKQFVIIFRQRPRTFTKADLARRQEEVSAWARAQNVAGHKLEPRILAPDVLRAGPATTREDGVASDAWPITALLFLEASDLAEAAKIAGSHPANRFGANVEVRPWAPPVVPPLPPAARP